MAGEVSLRSLVKIYNLGGLARFGPSLIDQALVSGGSFLTIVVSARLLPLADQGKLGYIVAAYLATIIINTTVIFQWASVQAPYTGDKEGYRRDLACFQVFLAVLSALGSTGIIALLASSSGWVISPLEAGIMAVFLFVQQLADFDRRSSYIFFSARRAVATSFSVYVPRIALLIFLRPSNIVEVFALISLASLWPAARVFAKSLHARMNLGLALRFFTSQPSDARWLMASGPLVWVWATLPLFFLGSLLSMEVVGIFITIRSLANVANVAMELLETQVSASAGRLYVSSREGFFTMFRKMRLLGGVFWLAGFLVIFLFGSRVLGFIYGPAYSGYNGVLLILWAANGIIFLFRLNAVILRTTERSNAVTLGYLAAVVIMLLSSYHIIGYMGVMGGALMLCIGALANYVCQSLLGLKAGA